MELRALTWNLFHGRDHPPDPALLHLALAAAADDGAQRAPTLQVNRDLLDEFAAVLAAADWDVALLQECPPRWATPLAAATGAGRAPGAHLAQLARARCAPLLARVNPDLIASNEGGSNLTLVRGRDRRAPRARAAPRARGPSGG